MENIKIIKEPSTEEPFLVIYKAAGLASAPLKAEDKKNALYQAGLLYPELYRVKGKKEIEYGLLHRIDTQTKGLLLIATEQAFYDYMNEEQKEGRFLKYYKAICIENQNNTDKLEGFPPIDPHFHIKLLENNKITIQSYFRNYGSNKQSVRPVTAESSKIIKNKIGKLKLYSTEIQLSKVINDDNKKKYQFICKIKAGYRHQVRAHLCWLGFPICGDMLYNPADKEKCMQFEASGLSFNYKGKKYDFTGSFDQEPLI